jgi:hypothetical protein
MGDAASLTVAGEGLLEANVWETQAGFTLHLINYNGPRAMHGQLRKPLPLGPQTVTMTLPDSRKNRRINLLEAGRSVDFSQNGTTVRFTVPSVAFYEVAALTI